MNGHHDDQEAGRGLRGHIDVAIEGVGKRLKNDNMVVVVTCPGVFHYAPLLNHLRHATNRCPLPPHEIPTAAELRRKSGGNLLQDAEHERLQGDAGAYEKGFR